MSDHLERLRRDHRASFLRWLSQRDEAGRRSAYELGREALHRSIGILEVVRVHNEVVQERLQEARSVEESVQLAEAAGEYLMELVAPYEMARRGFMDLGPGRSSGPAPSGPDAGP